MTAMPYETTMAAHATLYDDIAAHFGRIGRDLDDLAVQARTLSAATDWQARAAHEFHAAADTWAGTVAGLGSLADTARTDAQRAAEASRIDPLRFEGRW